MNNSKKIWMYIGIAAAFGVVGYFISKKFRSKSSPESEIKK